MLTLLLIFSLTTALLISQSIVGTIKQVTKSILKLSSFKRDYSQRIHVTMNDEVKDLSAPARQAGGGPNPARQVSIRSGVPNEVPAYTVNKACAWG